MRFAYQSGVAISHWQTANLGTDFQAVALTWRVPAMRTDRTGDLLVIQPGVPGDGTGADIKSIKIDCSVGLGPIDIHSVLGASGSPPPPLWGRSDFPGLRQQTGLGNPGEG